MTAHDVDYYLPGYSDDASCVGVTEREIIGRGRNMQVIDAGTVALAESRIRQSGVLARLEAWKAEDRTKDGLGGRPEMISTRAVLTALLLLAHENAPLHIKRVSLLLEHRLHPESRDLLDLPEGNSSFITYVVSEQRWYDNTIRAFRRMLKLLDPYPQERYTSKSYEQIWEILEAHDEERAQKYKARLDEFTRLFLHMTFMMQPRDIRRASRKLDVSFDQTYVGIPTTKGYSHKNLPHRVAEERKASDFGTRNPGPVEAFAGWHAKSGKGERKDYTKDELNEVAPGRGEYTNYDWGWVANIMVRVDAEAPGSKRFPHLIVGASLSIPNMEVAEEAFRLLLSATMLGLEPGIADADKQYWAGSVSERLLKPALKAGYTPSTDYRVDQLGIKGGQHGALQVEGDFYCPNTPESLLNASKDLNTGIIDIATYRARIEERKAHRLHVKQKANSEDGTAYLRCPALGSSPTVTCPLRDMALNAAKKARPHVEPETLEKEFLDTICVKHSAAFDLTNMRAPKQAFDYGTEEWDEFHDHARNTVESENHHLKASGDEDIATAGRRRVRGPAAAQIMITMLLVAHNIRKIAAFLSDREKENARTTPLARTLRRRDRAWANRYTKTTGNGDLTIPRRRKNTTREPDALAAASAITVPLRT